MTSQKNIRILKGIAKKISDKLHCDRHGSCVHFAEIFVEEINEQYPELLNDFDVIEGYVNVKFGDGIPQEHTWIRLNNGDIIDPTFSQFDKYDKNAQYSKKRTKVYSGQEYYDEGKEGSWFSERRKKLPSSVFKKGLQESIRRILKEETESGKYTKAIQGILEYFKNEDCVCDIDMWYDDEDDMYLVYLVFGTEELNDKFTSDGKFGYVRKKQKEVEETIKSYLPIKNIRVGSYGTPHCGWKSLNESENKTNSSLHRLLNMLFDGFDDIYYDWANYGCGMGECCDPYAIGFTLPNKHYDDYIFKLVDGDKYDDYGDYPKELRDDLPEPCYQQPDIKDPKFDTIVFYGHYSEEIEDYMGPESNWKSDLLKIINKQFGCDAWEIIII